MKCIATASSNCSGWHVAPPPGRHLPLHVDLKFGRHECHSLTDSSRHLTAGRTRQPGRAKDHTSRAVRDPDVSNLVELDGELRRYRARDGHVYMKQLVNGRWAYFF